MIRNSFFILVFLVFHVVRAKTLQVDVREKAQELLSELRLTVNNSGKGIQVAYAGKELKARGVSNGDYLVSVNGVNAVPSVSLSAWIEGLGETRTGGVGVLPLVEVDDTIGEGPTVTDGYPLNGFIRIEVVPLSDATILSFSCSGTYPHEEHLKAEADNEQVVCCILLLLFFHELTDISTIAFFHSAGKNFKKEPGFTKRQNDEAGARNSKGGGHRKPWWRNKGLNT